MTLYGYGHEGNGEVARGSEPGGSRSGKIELILRTSEYSL